MWQTAVLETLGHWAYWVLLFGIVFGAVTYSIRRDAKFKKRQK
jgi:hypothetical protein